MMPRRAVVDAAACAIIIGVLAIIGAVWVVVQAVGLLMPVFVFIDTVNKLPPARQC